jgi:hypothetical protein
MQLVAAQRGFRLPCGLASDNTATTSRYRSQDRDMKRSRRVVLTMMGSAAAGAVSMGWVGAPNCGRYEDLYTPPEGGRPFCRVRSGFGVTSQTIYTRPVHGGVVHTGRIHHSGGVYHGGGVHVGGGAHFSGGG